jgi:hypothetical protein
MLQLDGISGRLLDESAITDIRELGLTARIEAVPNPEDAAPVRPVVVDTTITEYADGRVIDVFTGQDVIE